MVNDSGHLDTLIKSIKSCIFPRNANGNILLIRDASRCPFGPCIPRFLFPLYFCFFRNSWIASPCSRVGFFRPANQFVMRWRSVPITRASSDRRPYFASHHFFASANSFSVFMGIGKCSPIGIKFQFALCITHVLHFVHKKDPLSVRALNGSITVKLIRALPMSSICTFLWGVKRFHLYVFHFADLGGTK